MAILTWIALRLAFAILWGALLFWLAYRFIVPLFVYSQYRRQGMSLDKFRLEGGEEAAGSEDAVYFSAYYDCRRGYVSRITGPAPTADFWMIGIYDNRLQRVPGGHFNDRTVEVDEEGNFTLIIQPNQGNAHNVLECGRERRGLILMRVFLPDNSDVVRANPPAINRFKARRLLR